MLYVFQVDTGMMRTFDMNLALESVVQLKEAIEKVCHIPAEKQVLLVSGGELLDPTARVCSYSAGTDTNPIFLFSICIIESMTPPSPSIDYGSDIDLKEQVDATANMPHTYNTVVVRSQLAQQFFELAKDQTRICESLVHDQHLQQQGWAAVVANLEDVATAFRSRTEGFAQTFKAHLESREEHMLLLRNYKEDIAMLAKIRLMPALIAEVEAETDSGIKEDGKESSLEENIETVKSMNQLGAGDFSDERIKQEKAAITLFEWISAKDHNSSLEHLAEQCIRGLQQFDSNVVESLTNEMYAAFEATNKTEMKEIKGLEERLYGLEQLMFEAKKVVQEQSDLAQAFLQNQNRASNLGDPSILPDLCTSHKRQLLVMLKNHHHLRDIRRRCTRAKEELSGNLYHRLRWVKYVENHVNDVDSKLAMYHDSLNRLHRQIEIIRQVHQAPQMYVRAIGEVVRRRTFSQAFLVWASDLACQLLTVHNEEVARRQEFQREFKGHFLNTLFPGMEDFPPSFATQAPSVFDSGLPKLTIDDFEILRTELPELSISMSVPDLGAITQFFLSKSVSGTLKTEEKEDTAIEDRLVKVVSEAGLASNLDPTLLQPADTGECAVQGHTPSLTQDAAVSKEPDRGFESETDTEEFEKVGQSPVDLAFDSRHLRSVADQHDAECQQDAEAVGASHVSTLEENLGNMREEVERLHRHLRAAGSLLGGCAHDLRGELSGLRTLVLSELAELSRMAGELAVAASADRDAVVQRLTVDHELELETLRRETTSAADAREEQLRQFREEMAAKEKEFLSVQSETLSQLEQVRLQWEEQVSQTQQLEVKLEACEADKQRELREQAHDYKTELEGLRSRFRLMTTASMERSPSDSSLERIERTDLVDLAYHEQQLNQLREKLLAEKETALKAAVETERQQLEARFKQELKIAQEANKQVFFNNTLRVLMADKDRLLDELTARETVLVAECKKYQETIRRLTEEADSGNTSLESKADQSLKPLLEKIHELESENMLLQRQLAKESARKSRTLSETAIADLAADTKQPVTGDMSTSVAVMQDVKRSRDAATSPERLNRAGQVEHFFQENLTRSASSLIQQGKISIVSCNVGDPVLVVWNEVHRNYLILQETSVLHFVHQDCLDVLGLRPSSDGSQRKLYCTAEVTDKEYCHAIKPQNRFNVPKGTKFFRVKVRPLPKMITSRCQHRHTHNLHSSGASSSQQPKENSLN